MEIAVRPLLSHSNSFGFEMEKDAAGCRAFNRNYIVGGNKFATGTKENHKKKNYPLAAYFIMCNYSNDFCGFDNME